ncbi:hypothetical protein PSEUBRA_002286 [Kalmanozyma brasiliensis GHG001]|uniref:uncharacterized protein n=1 Tax=Kalmanozyma brasiliensis (strain GHG001) TaxID=1365824 RepID=UPI0028681092|nr:uncharacterized protein PSEUBRA_002286 [Kalmanozyma brasiliensis GHG001]KAF6767065.1 hypothetical protein PSEUBRA_002286 [Kalmanozyma brasiliensis GHG001]
MHLMVEPLDQQRDVARHHHHASPTTSPSWKSHFEPWARLTDANVFSASSPPNATKSEALGTSSTVFVTSVSDNKCSDCEGFVARCRAMLEPP